MILNLYEARARLYHATPGSTEWWRAIRDIRACHERLRDALAAFVRPFAKAYRSLVEDLRPLAELAAKVLSDGGDV